MIQYFESNGGRKCSPEENPAEYILDVIGAGATATSLTNWHDVWRKADESGAVQKDLDQFHNEKRNEKVEDDGASHPEYASGFLTQLKTLLGRSFRDYLRSPAYLMSKFMTCIAFGNVDL